MLVWPDQDAEPQGEAVVGVAAVGRPLALKEGGKERGNKGWRLGLVCDFDASTAKHAVHFIPLPSTEDRREEDEEKEKGEDEEVEEEREVELSSQPIMWLPTENDLCAKTMARVASPAPSLSSSSSSSSVYRRPEGVGEDRSTPLLNSAEDIGTRLKVWWGKDKMYYIGTVTGFDAMAGTHVVSYDDGDVRKYVMANKEYFILQQSAPAARRQAAPPPAAAAAAAVRQTSLSSSAVAAVPVGPTAPAHQNGSATPPSFPPSLYIHAKRPPASHQGVSCHLVSNINIFLCLGGLRTLSRRLYHSFHVTPPPSRPPSRPPSHPPSLSFLRLYLSLLHLLRGRLEIEALNDAVFHLKETLPTVMLALGDEERNKLTKQELRALPQQLQVREGRRGGGRGGEMGQNFKSEKLHAYYNDGSMLHPPPTRPTLPPPLPPSLHQDLLTAIGIPRNATILAIDIFRLSLACALFKTKQLEKRLFGLNYIRDVIAKSTNSNETSSSLPPSRPASVSSFSSSFSSSSITSSQQHSRPGSLSLSHGTMALPPILPPSLLVQILTNANIVEELLGASMHIELLTRSPSLLRFLALHHALLPSPHLDSLWHSSLGKHEAVVCVLHTLLVDLLPFLPSALRRYLFDQMATLPFRKWEAETVELMYVFTKEALKAARPGLPATNKEDGEGEGRKEDEGEEAERKTAKVAGGRWRGGGGGWKGSNSSSSNSNIRDKMGQKILAPASNGHGNGLFDGLFGFGLLYKYLLDDKEVREASTFPPSLTSLAITHLVKLMREEEECGRERETVLCKCVANVRAHQSVPASLLLLARTVGTYPLSTAPVVAGAVGGGGGGRGGGMTMREVIDLVLEKQQGVWASLVFEELSWFQREVRRLYGPGREGGREGGRKGGRKGGREGGRKGGRKGEREKGREK